MEENCEDCMKWEEELYWTHFQTLHFSQLLLPGFHNRLPIPQKFSTHCKRKLPKIVTLKSPSGATYNVGLEEEDDEKTLAFSCGWDKFVKDHSLQENDLLVFKFHGFCEFDVLIFDGDSFCEKPTSYFVRKCGHADRKITTSKGTETSPKKIDLNTDEEDEPVDIDDLVVSQTGYHHHEQEEHINSDIDTASAQLPVTEPISEGKYPLSLFKKMRGQTSINHLCAKPAGSSRKIINESSKRKALSLAKSAVSPNGFLVVMKRSHVLSKCFLTIPYKWCAKNISLEPQEVVMQVDQAKWQMRFNYFGSRGKGGISTGWKKFVNGNNLCMGDVCVFEPVNSETKPFHIDVYIFRAAEAESSNNGA